jgi:hypothetical protein
MIQVGVIYHLQNRMNGSRLRIIRTVDEATYSSMNRRSRTHGAGLNCNKQLAAAEAMITQVFSRFAQRNYLGVGGWVVVGKVAVPSPSNNLALEYNDRSDGNLACLKRALGATQRFFHPALVCPAFF